MKSLRERVAEKMANNQSKACGRFYADAFTDNDLEEDEKKDWQKDWLDIADKVIAIVKRDIEKQNK